MLLHVLKSIAPTVPLAELFFCLRKIFSQFWIICDWSLNFQLTLPILLHVVVLMLMLLLVQLNVVMDSFLLVLLLGAAVEQPTQIYKIHCRFDGYRIFAQCSINLYLELSSVGGLVKNKYRLFFICLEQLLSL